MSSQPGERNKDWRQPCGESAYRSHSYLSSNEKKKDYHFYGFVVGIGKLLYQYCSVLKRKTISKRMDGNRPSLEVNWGILQESKELRNLLVRVNWIILSPRWILGYGYNIRLNLSLLWLLNYIHQNIYFFPDRYTWKLETFWMNETGIIIFT